MYKYYSTERPVSIGTYPKDKSNKPVNIKNFNLKTYVSEIDAEAYGYLEYQQPLSDKQIDDYELKEEKLNKDAAELGNCIKLGKLKKAALPWHEYLKEKKLLLFKLGGGYSLLSIVGEKGLRGLCKWCYENNRKDFDEMGYESLEAWIEECELGNDGFGFDKNEIEELGGMEEIRKELKP